MSLNDTITDMRSGVTFTIAAASTMDLLIWVDDAEGGAANPWYHDVAGEPSTPAVDDILVAIRTRDDLAAALAILGAVPERKHVKEYYCL